MYGKNNLFCNGNEQHQLDDRIIGLRIDDQSHVEHSKNDGFLSTDIKW
jgi:hypothetical protein